MLSKNDIQFIRSLVIKKYRQKYHKYLAEGEKIGLEILKSVPHEIETLYCTETFYDSIKSKLAKTNVEAIILKEQELGRISLLKTPNKVLLVMKMPMHDNQSISEEIKKVIYLDDVRDPGNMGTIIRSAEWFGIDLLLLSPNCVDPYNPKVVQSTMGSLFRINHMTMALDEFLTLSKIDFSIYNASMSGQSMYETNFKEPLVLIMGNESIGIQESLQTINHIPVHIPRSGTMTESLNVAVAASVLMAEMAKKK